MIFVDFWYRKSQSPIWDWLCYCAGYDFYISYLIPLFKVQSFLNQHNYIHILRNFFDTHTCNNIINQIIFPLKQDLVLLVYWCC